MKFRFTNSGVCIFQSVHPKIQTKLDYSNSLLYLLLNCGEVSLTSALCMKTQRVFPLSTQQIVAIKTVRRHPHWGAVPESCEIHPTRRHPNWGAVPERKSSVERRDFFLLHPSFSNNSSSKSSEKNSVCDFCSCATIQSTGKKITSCIGIRSIGFKIEQQALKKALQTTVLIKFDVRDWGGKN